MAKTMWCETFNFARSLRCLQRQGLKCFERILLMFLILRLVDFSAKQVVNWWTIQSEKPFLTQSPRGLLMSGNASTSQDGVYIYGLFIEGWDGWLHAFDAIWISTETCSIQVPCMRCTLGLWHPHGAPSNLIVKYCEMWKSPNKSPENCKSVSVRILFQTELLISIDICIFVSDSCPTAVPLICHIPSSPGTGIPAEGALHGLASALVFAGQGEPWGWVILSHRFDSKDRQSKKSPMSARPLTQLEIAWITFVWWLTYSFGMFWLKWVMMWQIKMTRRLQRLIENRTWRKKHRLGNRKAMADGWQHQSRPFGLVLRDSVIVMARTGSPTPQTTDVRPTRRTAGE